MMDSKDLQINLLLAVLKEIEAKYEYLLKKTERLSNEYKKHAYYDPLTGLYNRYSFQLLLELKLKKASRKGEKVAVIFMDMDDFKKINDSLGHTEGDKLLKLVGKRLSRLVRREDLLARLGGDEFIIAFSYQGGDEKVVKLVKRIQKAFKTPLKLNSMTVYPKMSIGISIYPINGSNVSTLLKKADMAMYHVKERGKGDYQFFSEDIQEKVLMRIKIEEALKEGISSDELFLVFQPRISLRDMSLTGAEVLLRWKSRTFGDISPATFIPIAEDSGMIYKLGSWLAGKVRGAIADLQRTYRKSLKFSINVSVKQLEKPDFYEEFLSHFINSSGRFNTSVEFEITETLLMQKFDEINSNLRKLKELGFGLLIDDFGSGYSSFARLKLLPADGVKIDLELIKDIDKDQKTYEIVKAIISFSKVLGLKTIAEGIERRKQLNILRDIGCDEAQGFLISKPLPAQDFIEILKKDKIL
jgi:diguanylate cyclase (GGDEF)-like protein